MWNEGINSMLARKRLLGKLRRRLMWLSFANKQRRNLKTERDSLSFTKPFMALASAQNLAATWHAARAVSHLTAGNQLTAGLLVLHFNCHLTYPRGKVKPTASYQVRWADRRAVRGHLHFFGLTESIRLVNSNVRIGVDRLDSLHQ